MTEEFSLVSPDFLEHAKAFREDWYKHYEEVSKQKTPNIDGTGRKIVNKRPDGYDYIEETYMRDMLDKQFPGWSWEQAAPLHFLGAEWVVAQGHLSIVDERLLAFNIVPPMRRFLGVDAVRIQFRTCQCKRNNQGKPIPACKICNGTGNLSHTPENIVDIGDNCKSANTAALKYAINRLCRIGDDIYGKRIEYEGAGTFESIIETNPTAKAFGDWVTNHKGNWVEVMEILGVNAMSEVIDWEDAYKKVKEKKGW